MNQNLLHANTLLVDTTIRLSRSQGWRTRLGKDNAPLSFQKSFPLLLEPFPLSSYRKTDVDTRWEVR
jgi:hypothetical protein